jgi:hypothetical protein
VDDPFGSVEPIPPDLLTAMEYCKKIFDASRISGFNENQALSLVAHIMTALVPR